MESNTEFHQLTRCPLSLHNTQINPVATPAEAVDFWHDHDKIAPPRFSRLTKQRLCTTANIYYALAST